MSSIFHGPHPVGKGSGWNRNGSGGNQWGPRELRNGS